MLNIEKETENCINWIKDYFKNNGPDSKMIIGISGGKDSSVCAALGVKALGKDRILGVLMPNNIQSDIDDSLKLCKHLDINYITINIGDTYNELCKQFYRELDVNLKSTFTTNTPARLRMTTLYGVAAMTNGRVVNTSNLSEGICGWGTLWGDTVGDFAPIRNFLVNEVVQIGDYLKLPMELTHKTPSDGMSGKSDEDNLGFSYNLVEEWFLNNKSIDKKYEKVSDRYNKYIWKSKLINIPSYEPTR